MTRASPPKPAPRLPGPKVYFFRLSNYADKLLAHYALIRIHRPQTRANEVIRFVEDGLEDLSISRTSFDWGIPVPQATDPALKTDKQHVMYVWVDALTNYITGAGFPDADSELTRYWLTCTSSVRIFRFHCIFSRHFDVSKPRTTKARHDPRLPQ